MAKTADRYLEKVKDAMAQAAADKELPAKEYWEFLDTIEADAQAALDALDEEEDDDEEEEDEEDDSDLDDE